MDWKARITLDPAIMLGKPVIKGSRLTVDFIVELMAEGWSEKEIVDNYPGITTDDIRACLAYALESLQAEKVYRLGA